jgi:hypothetical protein
MSGGKKDDLQREATRLWALGRALRSAEVVSGADHSDQRAEIAERLNKLNAEIEAQSNQPPKS